MAEAKWIKVNVSMFRDPKLLLIDDMENSDLIYYVWTSSLLLAGECNMNGCLYISDGIPYSTKMISVVFRRNEEDVKKAYDVLISLGMIERTEDGVYAIKNWEKHQNVESLDKIRKQTRERVARYREKKRNEKSGTDGKCTYDDSEIHEGNEMNKADEGNEINKIDEVSEENEVHEDGEEELSEGNDDVMIQKDTNDSGNVTDTHKKEKDKKKKSNRREKKTNEKSVSQSHKGRKSEKSCDMDIEEMNYASQLSEYCDSVTGKIGLLDVGALRIAISVHGRESVKKAIDKSIGAGKVNMAYINGILKNWKKEGYPEDKECYGGSGINYGITRGGKTYGGKYGLKADSKGSGEFEEIREFEGIRRQEPKQLTEDERNRMASKVI